MATTHTSDRRKRSLASTFALVVGLAFLGVGILGFVPGITQNLGDIELLGHESRAELLGIFQVSVLHNIVHLLFGALGLWAAKRDEIAVPYLFAGGATYLVLTLYGAVVGRDSDANFVPVNTADDWLHLFLGVGMIALGAIALAAARSAHEARTTRRHGTAPVA